LPLVGEDQASQPCGIYRPGSPASTAARIIRFAVAERVGQASISRAKSGSFFFCGDPLHEFQMRLLHALGFEDVPVDAAGISKNPLCYAPGVDLEVGPASDVGRWTGDFGLVARAKRELEGQAPSPGPALAAWGRLSEADRRDKLDALAAALRPLPLTERVRFAAKLLDNTAGA
jgi:hypothetical protein